MNLGKKIDKLPSYITRILRAASLVGDQRKIRVFLVGGGVRDMLLDKRNFDIDLAVEGEGIRFSQLLQQELGGEIIKHSDFDTATLKLSDIKVDVSACRREDYAFAGALPRVSPASLEEDLQRRDFTINAMAVSLNKDTWGELIDLFGGRRDLRQKQLNVLHAKSFIDDPTRILRCLRLKVKLGFKYSSSLKKLLSQAKEKELLRLVNVQRIRDELILMLKEQEPYLQMKELNSLFGLKFIDESINISNKDLRLILNAQKTILRLKEKSLLKRELDEWIIYMMVVVCNLNKKNLASVLAKMRLRRGEEKRIVDSHRKEIVRQLKTKITSFRIYKLLKPLSFEVIVFFYVKEKNRILRRNIIDFLAKYNNITLNISGKDLLQLGVKPSSVYGKILDALLKKKLKGKIYSLTEELEEARAILRRWHFY